MSIDRKHVSALQQHARNGKNIDSKCDRTKYTPSMRKNVCCAVHIISMHTLYTTGIFSPILFTKTDEKQNTWVTKMFHMQCVFHFPSICAHLLRN